MKFCLVELLQGQKYTIQKVLMYWNDMNWNDSELKRYEFTIRDVLIYDLYSSLPNRKLVLVK